MPIHACPGRPPHARACDGKQVREKVSRTDALTEVAIENPFLLPTVTGQALGWGPRDEMTSPGVSSWVSGGQQAGRPVTKLWQNRRRAPGAGGGAPSELGWWESAGTSGLGLEGWVGFQQTVMGGKATRRSD